MTKRQDVADDLAIRALSDKIRPVFHRMARQLRKNATDNGLYSLDYFILIAVKVEPGIGVTELSRMEGTTQASMSAHVKRLKEAGLLAVEEDRGGDLRRSPLIVTEPGFTAIDLMRSQATNWLTQQVAGLSSRDRHTLEAAIPALENLLPAGYRSPLPK